MTMVGDFHYQPNFDAAWWFARRVLPLVRVDHPDAEFRLVGRGDDLGALDREPGVVLRGRVDDISAELREADFEVVPLRSGGGTRVKVLEAFAHRLPVVSTTIGCEGLDVVDGVHVLLADEPSTFARACSTLIAEPERRARLADAAFGLYSDRFRWAELRPCIVRLATDVASRARTAG